MLLLATLPMFALSYHAVNVDKVTAATMTTTRFGGRDGGDEHQQPAKDR